MNWRYLGPKGPVENSVEKRSGANPMTTLLTPAKNAALIAVLTIISLFSATYA